MFIGRNFWKSSLLVSAKCKIFFSSSKFVISWMELMACSCAFPLKCFLAFWIAWKWCSHLCIWLFYLSRHASTFVDSTLGNSTEHAFGTLNLCHLRYTSNSHRFSYSFDHGHSSVVVSIVVLSAPSFLGSPTMMCPIPPSLSYVYIGALTKSLFFPTHVSP